jgi:hypothetical protein
MSIHLLPSLLLALVFSALPTLNAQDPTQSSIVGQIDGNSYLSPTHAFSVTIPVLAELGGSITDTDNVVTFQDAFSTHQSIACFKMDPTQRFEEETRGRKEYLIWFFSNFVQADFQQRFPGSRIESAHYLANVQAGTLLTYNLLPGGSMFAPRAMVASTGDSLVAKRGNLVFVQNGYVYVISIELAEKALESTAYNKTVAEEDALLRTRLLAFLDKITFTAPTPTPTAAEKSTAPVQPVATPAK